MTLMTREEVRRLARGKTRSDDLHFILPLWAAIPTRITSCRHHAKLRVEELADSFSLGESLWALWYVRSSPGSTGQQSRYSPIRRNIHRCTADSPRTRLSLLLREDVIWVSWQRNSLVSFHGIVTSQIAAAHRDQSEKQTITTDSR